MMEPEKQGGSGTFWNSEQAPPGTGAGSQAPLRNSHIPYPRVEDPRVNTDEFRPAQSSSVGSYAGRAGTAVASGAGYVKDRTVAGVTHLRERDWSREKEMANKAAATTKSAAVASGKWLSRVTKQGVDKVNSMRGPKPPSKPDSPAPF